VIVSSGGFHRGVRARQPDFLTAYLRHVLSTIGLGTPEPRPDDCPVAMKQKNQCHSQATDDVSQAVDSVVATSVRQQQGAAVFDVHESGRIAAVRGIQPIEAARSG